MEKRQKRRIWTKEQKLEIIDKHLNEHTSLRTLEKEYNADRSMICHRVGDYNKYGKAAFIPKGHPGDPFAALHTSKNITETEKLKLQLAKLEVVTESLTSLATDVKEHSLQSLLSIYAFKRLVFL